MNQADWKALHREARQHAKAIADICRERRGAARLRLDHGFTWFNVDCLREPGKAAALTVQPAIIRDRSIAARVTEALAWSRYFRTRPAHGPQMRERNAVAARACIADARAIRLAASAFQGMPS